MAEGGPAPPDLETQKNEITSLMNKPMKKGDTWYLIDNRWFKQWKKYVGCDSWEIGNAGEQITHPGPIDNSPLFKDESNEIRDHLIDELDYVLVPEEVWDRLVSWYTLTDCQEPIARKVVEHGMFVKQCKVEVYLMEFKLCQNNDFENYKMRKFSKTDTIEHLEKVMREIFNIPDNKETRLWNRYTNTTYEHLSKKDNTIQDAGLYQGQVLVIEQRNDDGMWPRQIRSTSSLGYNSSSEIGEGDGKQCGGSSNFMSTRFGSVCSYGSYGYEGANSVKPGLCGLSNLGNTCFMNSALQCMSNCPPLTQYFLEDHYWSELNTENPLGMRGEIAKSFGELVKNMWSGHHAYTVPRNFKMQVGRFAPQFSGYQQQDSQELMAFLLDGLHEDLNRIKKKPYIEQKDADGRPDAEVAREAWENYTKRNDSIIVDIFHGLLKSTVVCPECSKVSVTFDPFCCLTLPLPIKKERPIEVFFIPLNPMKKYVQYKVTVPKCGSVADLCAALSKFTDVPPAQMVVTDVYNHKFHKIFEHDEGLTQITDRDDIFVYEKPPMENSDLFLLPVYMREKRLKPGCNNYYTSSSQLFGQPLLVPIPREGTTYEKLYQLILQRIQRFVRVPDPHDEWWVSDDSSNGEGQMVNGDDDYEIEMQNCDASEKHNAAAEHKDGKTEEPNCQHMFTIHLVNAYGNAEMDKLKTDGLPIEFSNRMYMAIDWHPVAREKFYDSKVAEDMEQHESVHYRPSTKKQVIQLGECLELFTATEKLSAEDSWYCPSCKKHQQATKKFDLWKLPRILILSFKRFSYNRYWRDKIDTLVEFPIRNLNMANYLINDQHEPAVYSLIAVSNHYGGMGGGHYTAFAKNKDDHQWYYFDDNNVTQSSGDSVVSKAAYVLFYVRRDPGKPATPPRDIPATVGTLEAQDNGHVSSDEDLSMDTN